MLELYIVESHKLIRIGLEEALVREDDITLKGCCSSGLQSVDELLAVKPHVALINIHAAELNGIEVTRRLVAANASTAVLILADSDDIDMIRQSIFAGARGCVLKNSSAEQIILAIKSVAEGALWLDPAIAEDFLQACPALTESPNRSQHLPAAGMPRLLSERERQVLSLIAEGNNNKQIATLLSLSKETVKLHVRSITRKLQVADRSQAVALAMRENLLEGNSNE